MQFVNEDIREVCFPPFIMSGTFALFNYKKEQ